MESRLSILNRESMMSLIGGSWVDKDRFGELVRQAREARGIKAFELADLMHTHGSAISRLENGTFKETPAPDVLAQLSEHLGLEQIDMLRALGYLPERDAMSASAEPDELRDQMTALVRQVRWREKPDLAHSLITVMRGILQDQQRAGQRQASSSGQGH